MNVKAKHRRHQIRFTRYLWPLQLALLVVSISISGIPLVAFESRAAEPQGASQNGIQIAYGVNDLATIKSPVYFDTRRKDACVAHSIVDAICLNSMRMSYPDGRLASFRDINWLLGTMAVDGSRSAIVFGDSEQENYFVAGVLYLLGQHSVYVYARTASALLEQLPTGIGRGAGIVRASYYRAPMRDKHILIDADVESFFQTSPPPSRIADDNGVFVYARGDNERLVLASTPLSAIAVFSQLLAEVSRDSANTKILVHVDGLGKRRPTDFGAREQAYIPDAGDDSSGHHCRWYRHRLDDQEIAT